MYAYYNEFQSRLRTLKHTLLAFDDPSVRRDMGFRVLPRSLGKPIILSPSSDILRISPSDLSS